MQMTSERNARGTSRLGRIGQEGIVMVWEKAQRVRWG